MFASRSGKVAFSLTLFLALFLSAPAFPAPASSRFYPGVSEYQSMRAHDALRAFYNGNLPRAERLLRDLEAHEDAEALPPLGRLLQTAMLGLTLQRDDAASPEARARVRAAFDSAADEGLRICVFTPGKPNLPVASTPTCRLIEGGIRGFRALLALEARAPTEVLSEGLDAVSQLEHALTADSTVRDAHLGLGIFHAMAASNAPRVVRGMLRAAGRGVDFQQGLAHLRRSGYEGQYTTVASQFFLIRFLSPYDDELRREKTEIFKSLRAVYPLSPLVPFLQQHEALVFYPDSFYRPRARVMQARTLRAVEERDYAGQRYVQLLKYQHTLLVDEPDPRYRPDTTFDLGGYAFYPAFIEALRLRRAVLQSDLAEAHAGKVPGGGVKASGVLDEATRAATVKQVAEARKRILAALKKTPKTLLNPQNRGLYEWHVGEALRPEQFKRSPPAVQAADTTSKAAGKSRKPPER